MSQQDLKNGQFLRLQSMSESLLSLQTPMSSPPKVTLKVGGSFQCIGVLIGFWGMVANDSFFFYLPSLTLSLGEMKSP